MTDHLDDTLPAAATDDTRETYSQLVTVDPAHYVITRELARGGMGRIQVARDRRLGREVAVKEVLISVGSIARRFEREARITARLQHPSIISVHEAGKWPSGEPFYAMRLVTGRSLDEAIAAAKTYAQRLALLPNVLAIADAMAYAHGQGVIHRDLKPKNTMVGDFGETVVIDWGLAKELGSIDESISISLPPSSGESHGETTLGEVLGTPQYMPPEQAAGESVDERADVYAIGSILYHVLAGRPPYVAESNAELIAALSTAPPLPVSHFVPEVSDELVAIVERAMARDRAHRYPTAKELAEDLRRHQTGQLVGAHRYSLRQLLGRWVRRHRTGLAAIAAALVVAIAIGVVAVKRIVSAEHTAQGERETAIANGKRAQELADFMLGDLRDRLGDIGRLDLLAGVAKQVIASHDPADENERKRAASATMVLAASAAQRGDSAGALALFTQARELIDQLVALHPDDPKYLGKRLDVGRNISILLGRLGKRAEAEQLAVQTRDDALAALVRFPDEPSIEHAAIQAHVKTAAKLRGKKDYDAALRELYQALEIAQRLPRLDGSGGDPRRTLEQLHGNLGDALAAADRHQAAIGEYQQCLGISLAAVASAPNNVFWLHHANLCERDVAKERTELGDLDGAHASLIEGLALAKRAYALDPANNDAIDSLAATDEKLGDNALARKDHDAALPYYLELATLNERLAAREPNVLDRQRDRATSLEKLGDLAHAKNDLPTAISRYRATVPIRQQLVERDPKDLDGKHDLASSHHQLGVLLAKAKEPDAAARELHAAEQLASSLHDADPANERYASTLVDVLGELATVERDGKPHLLRAQVIARDMAAKPNANKTWLATLDELAAKLR